MHRNTILAILLIASPILFVLAAYPDTFSMSWNQGRGGFLFALAFIVAELVGIKFAVSRNNLIFAIPLAVITIIYFVALNFGLHDYILDAAPAFNVQLIYSWEWFWDFVVMTLFVTTSAAILFRRKWIRILPAGPIFLGGSAIILSLDAFFRMIRLVHYNTLYLIWYKQTYG